MPQKDTLVIVGNGFDIWQGLDTSYADFQAYYLKHRNEILKKLRIKKKLLKRKDGSVSVISDVELIYGNPFRPADLGEDFWHTFEASLGKLDALRLNYFFGKEKKGLKAMAKSVMNAHRILKEAFCSWIATIRIAGEDSGFRFRNNCHFINFNYTDTLEKRFGVRQTDVIHIHGQADDPESIIFGSAIHPQTPEDTLYRLGGRFRGLFLIEYILFQTDKHVMDNITMLCWELSLAGVNATDIKDIYVLGHSLGDADLEYFAFLNKVTAGKLTETEEMAALMANEGDSMEELHNRMQYIIKTYGKDFTITDAVTQEEKDAIRRKFLREQQERDEAVFKTVWRMFRKNKRRRQSKAGDTLAYAAGEERQSDARWHITYHSAADKERAEQLMKTLGCTNYELFGSIDEAVEQIRRK